MTNRFRRKKSRAWILFAVSFPFWDIMDLLVFPDEILFVIIDCNVLTAYDRARLSRVCHRLRRLVQDVLIRQIRGSAVSQNIRKWFETEYKDASEVERDFRIQYTVFEYVKIQKEYYMNSTLTEAKNEGIYDAKELAYSETTNVEFWSWKGNYDEFQITDNCDHRGESDSNDIFLIDLYPDHEPKHFKGEVWSRGGFIGWNWLEF